MQPPEEIFNALGAATISDQCNTASTSHISITFPTAFMQCYQNGHIIICENLVRALTMEDIACQLVHILTSINLGHWSHTRMHLKTWTCASKFSSCSGSKMTQKLTRSFPFPLLSSLLPAPITLPWYLITLLWNASPNCIGLLHSFFIDHCGWEAGFFTPLVMCFLSTIPGLCQPTDPSKESGNN